MNKSVCVGAVVTLVIAMVVGFGGWMFNAVADMPEEYVKKQDYREDMRDVNKKLDKLIEHLIGG
jgi:hypothetical protein